jgi:hypothetical protein
MLSSPKNNWAIKFSPDDFTRLRQLMISCVLATDMSKHMSEIGSWKTRIQQDDFDPAGTDKMLTLSLCFHLADISNPVKKFKICRQWSDLLYIEFFAQGDLEKR